MSGAEILSLIGIIIGLAVLVVLVMKGINIMLLHLLRVLSWLFSVE